MKVVIIEDELPAADKLARYLKKYDDGIEVLAVLGSVSESVKWLNGNADAVDLLFVDVQLSDGLSFEIFSQVKIHLPVIFTTAFDEFAVDAFKVHSIDYLLKPVTFTDLTAAVKKYERIKIHYSGQELPPVLQNFAQKRYKDRFMVKLGTHIHSIRSEEVAVFHADGRTVYLTTQAARKFVIEYRLEELLNLLDPKQFFRVNRTFIININAVTDVVVYSNSRLNIKTGLLQGQDIIVSREKVAEFKNWLEGA